MSLPQDPKVRAVVAVIVVGTLSAVGVYKLWPRGGNPPVAKNAAPPQIKFIQEESPTYAKFEWQITGGQFWSNASSNGFQTTMKPGRVDNAGKSLSAVTLTFWAIRHPGAGMDVKAKFAHSSLIDRENPKLGGGWGSSTQTFSGLPDMPLSKLVKVLTKDVAHPNQGKPIRLAELNVPPSQYLVWKMSRYTWTKNPRRMHEHVVGERRHRLKVPGKVPPRITDPFLVDGIAKGYVVSGQSVDGVRKPIELTLATSAAPPTGPGGPGGPMGPGGPGRTKGIVGLRAATGTLISTSRGN